MRLFSKTNVALVLILALSACSNASLEELRTTAPKGTPFQAQLAARYLQYADTASKDGANDRATYFSEKGLQAAYGQDVSPEDPTQVTGEGETLMELNDANEKLLELLDTKQGDERPRAFADAQFYYDCWFDQTSNGGRDAEFCKDKFNESYEELTKVAAEEAAPTETADAAPEAAATEAEVKPTAINYLVYFALNRAELNDAAKRTVAAILKDLEGKEEIEIVVNGHTDTSGDDKYNMALSHRRAGVVKKALIALGVDAKRIKTFGFGETDPVVKTEDGVVEEKNRRAEIVVN
jgi:OmpA-OmpF porin, OOP family